MAQNKNPDNNYDLIGRAKSSRKNSRVTRSQINDFHAQTNTNDDEEEVAEEEEEKMEMKMKMKSSNRNHVCRHCDRAFSSGRALGGHIRIHGESRAGGRVDKYNSSNNNSSSNSLLKPPEVGGSENSDSDSESASSHGFSKMVSLYTLRNNPKRSSILMDPEFALDLIGASAAASGLVDSSVSTAKRSRNTSKSQSKSKSSSGMLAPYSGSELRNLMLPNWSVTKSRSSRGAKRDLFLLPKEDRDTAQLLVMLAGRRRRNNNEGIESTEESVFDSKPMVISNLESQGSIEDLGGSGEEESGIVEKKRKQQRKKNSHKNEANEGLIEEEHQCNTCKKVFNSHQALGGHRASHRNVKGCFSAEGENEEGEGSLMVEAAVEIEEDGAVAISHLTQEQESVSHKMGKQAHRCSICHRVFGSGQALGGHKRCHWIGDRITETTTSAISTEQHQQESGIGGGSFRARSVREEVLDLNQPPPMDEDYFRGSGRFDACAESVNQRVRIPEGSFGNRTVDSFKAD